MNTFCAPAYPGFIHLPAGMRTRDPFTFPQACIPGIPSHLLLSRLARAQEFRGCNDYRLYTNRPSRISRLPISLFLLTRSRRIRIENTNTKM